jgi:hypothetical protein
MTYSQLRPLSKASLIEIGFEQIRESLKLDTSPTEIFDKISVFANDDEIHIEFENQIKFIPLNTEFYYDVTVQLVHSCISYSIYSNGEHEKNSLETNFFKPTAESENAIRFVMGVINRSEGRNENESRQEFLKDFEGDLVIRDAKDHYDITRTSEWQESWYKIDKTTGKIYDEGHAHLEPVSMEGENKLVEIVE